MIVTDTLGRPIVINNGGICQIEFYHYRIHEGRYYTVADYATGITDAAPKYWHIKAPDSAVRGHCVIALACSESVLASFYEAPTLGANGTELTALNNDRNSANTTTFLYYKDPTVNADGTLLWNDKMGTNNSKTRVGAQSRQNAEYILKQNTSYVVKILPDNGVTAAISCVIEIYEL